MLLRNVRGSGMVPDYRDGHCSTGQDDEGRHTVCIEATVSSSVQRFRGQRPEHAEPVDVPGVMPGDQRSLRGGTPKQCKRAQPKVHLARTRAGLITSLEVCRERRRADAARATLESVDEQRQALEGLFSRVANPED